MSTSLLKLVADLDLSLALQTFAGDTSATLNTDTDGDGNILPTGLYGFTIQIDASDKEYIVCSLSGTALTNIMSIDKQGNATTGFSSYHRAGSTVTITDWAVLSRLLNNLNGTTGFDAGTNLGYDGTPSGLSGNQFATVNYVLTAIGAGGGTVTTDALIVPGVVAANTTKGQICYLNSSGQWALASASTIATCLNVILAICQVTQTMGGNSQFLLFGTDGTQTSLSTGSTYYLQNTSGAIGTAAGTISVNLGIATASTVFQFRPRLITTSTTGTNGAVPIAASTKPYLDPSWLNAAVGIDQSQEIQNGTIAVGQQNLTGDKFLVAEKFIPGITSGGGVTLFKAADTGSFVGTVKISIQADSAGSPSGSDLASYTISNAAWLKLNTSAKFTVSFGSEYESLIVGNPYWLVVTPSTTDNTNHPNLGLNTAGGYASGALKYNNSVDGWVLVATSILTFETLSGVLSKFPLTSASTGQLPQQVLPYSFLAADATTQTVSSTTSPTTMFSKQLAGALLGLNGGLKIRVFGRIDLNSGTTGTTLIAINYNGSTLTSLTSPSAGSSNTISRWDFIADFTIINSASLSVQVGIALFDTQQPNAQAGTATIATLFNAIGAAAVSATVDTSQPGLLEIVFTNSNNSALKATYSGCVIEKIG